MFGVAGKWGGDPHWLAFNNGGKLAGKKEKVVALKQRAHKADINVACGRNPGTHS